MCDSHINSSLNLSIRCTVIGCGHFSRSNLLCCTCCIKDKNLPYSCLYCINNEWGKHLSHHFCRLNDSTCDGKCSSYEDSEFCHEDSEFGNEDSEFGYEDSEFGHEDSEFGSSSS